MLLHAGRAIWAKAGLAFSESETTMWRRSFSSWSRSTRPARARSPTTRLAWAVLMSMRRPSSDTVAGPATPSETRVAMWRSLWLPPTSRAGGMAPARRRMAKASCGNKGANRAMCGRMFFNGGFSVVKIPLVVKGT